MDSIWLNLSNSCGDQTLSYPVCKPGTQYSYPEPEIIQLSPADSLLRLDFQQGGFNLGRIVIKETKTGIDDQQSSDEVKIYPVPVEEFLHFSSFKAIQKIEIFSLTGKAVYNNIFEEAKKQCRINLRHLSSGIYLAKIRFSDNLTYTTKIIKN